MQVVGSSDLSLLELVQEFDGYHNTFETTDSKHNLHPLSRRRLRSLVIARLIRVAACVLEGSY